MYDFLKRKPIVAILLRAKTGAVILERCKHESSLTLQEVETQACVLDTSKNDKSLVK